MWDNLPESFGFHNRRQLIFSGIIALEAGFSLASGPVDVGSSNNPKHHNTVENMRNYEARVILARSYAF